MTIPIINSVKPTVTMVFDTVTQQVNTKFEGFGRKMELTVAHLLPDGSILVVMEPRDSMIERALPQ